MEATTELLQKLQRRRERMGERCPLRDIDNALSESREKDFAEVKVRQRRTVFEGIENQAVPCKQVPGKLDLARWERSPRDHSETRARWERSPRDHSETRARWERSPRDHSETRKPVSPTDEAATREPHLAVASPPDHAATLQQADSPTSEYAGVLVDQALPDSSSSSPVANCQVLAGSRSVVASPKASSSVSGVDSSVSGGDSSSTSPPQQCDVSATSQGIVEHPAGRQKSNVGGLALGSQATSAAFGRKAAWPGRHLGRGMEAQESATEILKPLQAWSAPQQQASGCVFRRLSSGDPATPSPAKQDTNSTFTTSAEDVSGERGYADGEDEPEPLEYCLLGCPLGDIPSGFVEKIKVNMGKQDDYIRKLKRRNEKLRRAASFRPEVAAAEAASIKASTPSEPRALSEGRRRELVARGAAISIAAAQQARKREAAEDYEARMSKQLSRTSQQAEARIVSMTRRAERIEEDTQNKQRVANLERVRTKRELESMGSEIARTEAHISELEAEINLRVQQCRDKDAKRKEVAREVEELRNEARAHRRRAGKYVQTKQHIQDVSRQLEATRAAIASS